MKSNKSTANTNDTANRVDKANSLRSTMELLSFAYPLAYSFIVAGSCVYFGKISILEFLLLIFLSFSLQLMNNVAKVYGDLIDRHHAHTEYYKLKFDKYKRDARHNNNLEKHGAPMQGATIDLSAAHLRYMLIASAAASLVLGYGFIVLCTGFFSTSSTMIALSCYVIEVAILFARYMGPWSFGYRTYGNLILFVLIAFSAIGCFCLLLGSFVIVSLYPALAVASLGVAVANMRDIYNEQHDVEMSHTKMPRRTVPLSAGIKGSFMFQTVFVALSMIWLLAFPIAVSANNIWNYAFVIFYILFIIDLVALKRAKPTDMCALRKSLAVSTVLLGEGFFFSIALSNISTLVIA